MMAPTAASFTKASRWIGRKFQPLSGGLFVERHAVEGRHSLVAPSFDFTPPVGRRSAQELIDYVFMKFIKFLLNNENILALLFALAIILLIIVTADTSPMWIYQGF